MDIKNFWEKLSADSGKIKIAALAGFVFVAVLAVVFWIDGKTMAGCVEGAAKCVDDYNYSICSGKGTWSGSQQCYDLVGDVKLGIPGKGQILCKDGEYYNSSHYCKTLSEPVSTTASNNSDGTATVPAESVALAQQNQDLTSAQNVADGGACPCGLTHTVICSASAPSANGGYCKNGNCVDGKCKLLECAISDSDGKVIARIGEGVKTCTKPSVLSGNGVYVCGKDSQKSQNLYSSDGSLSSEKEPFSGTIVYNLNPEGTCYSGCSNGKCNDEAKCENLAKTIQDQFAKSYQPQTLACSNLSGDTQNEEYNKCKDCYDKVKTNTNKALSGFGDIVKVFEKLAYPNGLSCGGVWVISPDPNKSITNSAISSIRTDDILCAKTDTGAGGMTMNTACGKISVTGIQKNKICVGKDGEKFSSFLRGKSFDCKVINGCGVAGWILGDSPEKCNPGETNAFTLSDYFSKSGGKNANGVPVMGWGKGADQYGCEYVAYSQFAKVSDTDKSKNLYTYVQIPTGDCHKSGAAITAASDFSCADYELPKSGGTTTEECPEINFSGECSGGSPMFTVKEQGQGGLLPQQYKECGKNAIEFILGKEVSEDCGESFKAKCLAAFQNCSGSASTVECVSDNDCQKKFGSDYYCIYKGLAAPVGFCSNEGGCFSSSNGGKNFQYGAVVCGGNGTSQYCKTLKNPPSSSGWEMTPGGDCKKNDGTCNRDTGLCEGGKTTDCSTAPKGCLMAADDCEDCGAGWTCKSRSEVINATDYESLGLNATRAQISAVSGGDGICVKGTGSGTEETGECDFRINAGGTCSTSNTKCRNGVYVPFTITEISGNCDDLSCTVTNDFDNTSVDAAKASAGWWACSYPQSKSSGGDSEGTKGSDPSKLKFTIACDGKKATMTCPFPTADNNKFCEEEEEAQEEKKAEEGEKCKKDEDCGEGLVCLDGKCVTEEDAEEKEEQEKQDKTAPKVTISSPSGTINTKTAELSVSTDIEAECKYMLSRDGSFNDFSGGMFMGGGGGTSHTATLSNLTGVTAADCKYNHTVKVMCKNSKASQDAKSAVGSAQTNFSVDLSQKTENAPAVVAVMEPKYTVANPVLKVTTDRPADCEYKKDGDFSAGGGTKFDTTGSYVHNTQLNDLKTGDHTYYVVCKDKETCAANKPGLSVKFTVSLSDDPANAPKIASTTPETQTIANPALSVTTDRPATCQYKKDVSFTYDDGGGTQFANDGEYAHSVSLADLPDGKHTFYVACKDKASGAKKTLETAIVTTLNRGGAAGAPVISNTTPASQNTNSPTLSVITDRPATCQYKQDADFTYGQGMQFAIDAGTGHSTVLANAADGTYVFYVVCQDPATRISSAPGAQIIFTVNTASGNCASLSSNDRQNDNERDYDDEDDYDSTYVWRSAAAGTVEMFEKVDWYAGYQFASEEDGYVTQLCGYFDSGARNRVSLYDGNYKELAGVEVEGRGGWNCANIAPVKVKADRRYYVITRVEDDAIYFSYKSGLLPREAGNTVVEYGVRQLGAAGDFGEDLKKYDYMVFGLVDAKIKFVEDNSRGPQVSSPLPDGDDEKSDLILSVQTNEDATCKFDREDLEYKEMEYTFGATGQKLHQQKICNLDDGPFTWYVRCKGATDTNDGSTAIQFEVDD